MLTSIQVILLLFIIFALSRVLLRLKERVISTKAAIFWSFLWISAFAGILLPQTTSRVAEYFGVGRGVDVILYLSLALLFYLVFRIYVMVEDIKSEITKIVRTVALNKASKSKNKKGR